MVSSCLARAGLSARHATRAASMRLDQFRSISLLHAAQEPVREVIARPVPAARPSFDGTRPPGLRAQHSRQRRHRSDLGLPDRQPWARPVIDDIGGGQLTGCDLFGDHGPRIGDDQRHIGRQKWFGGAPVMRLANSTRSSWSRSSGGLNSIRVPLVPVANPAAAAACRGIGLTSVLGF